MYCGARWRRVLLNPQCRFFSLSTAYSASLIAAHSWRMPSDRLASGHAQSHIRFIDLERSRLPKSIACVFSPATFVCIGRMNATAFCFENSNGAREHRDRARLLLRLRRCSHESNSRTGPNIRLPVERMSPKGARIPARVREEMRSRCGGFAASGSGVCESTRSKEPGSRRTWVAQYLGRAQKDAGPTVTEIHPSSGIMESNIQLLSQALKLREFEVSRK